MDLEQHDARLERFLSAQRDNYEIALQEIKSGLKQSHWMWYIFPQLRGLGRSDMARDYGIDDLAEAELYLKDETLSKQLVEISGELLKLNENNPIAIFGKTDARKLQSCMTLFSRVKDAELVFEEVLLKYYLGYPDENTLRILDEQRLNQNA